jgi:hypothetical protein
MALVVEDGTARADAESYCSVAAADTYHANRGNTVWAALTQTVKEQCLRKATDYLVAIYRNAWDGYRKTTTQALDWPRFMVPIKDNFLLYGFGQIYYDDASVPAGVQNGCAELALKVAGGTELAPDLGPEVLREKVGPIETDYAQGARQTTRFYAVENMLQPYLAGGASSRKVSRA